MADSNFGLGSNPYLDQQVQNSLGDTVKAWNMVQQPAFNAAMVRSGSFGNEGVNQMNQYGQQQLQASLGRQANDMRSNNYQFDQNFGLANQQFDKSIYDTTFNQNQQQFNNGLNLIGMQNSANQQNLGLGTTIQNTPMNYFGNFNQQANSIGQGYGTSAGTMTGQSSPLMGALGGMQLGNAIAKNWGGGWGSAPYNAGTQSGGWAGTSNAPFFYGTGGSGD